MPISANTDDLFEDLLALSAIAPGAPAIVGDGPSLSYAELVSASQSLATAIAKTGIGVGDCVALILPNGAALAVAAFATWRAGAAIVPLYSQLTADEIAARAIECGVSAVFGPPSSTAACSLVLAKCSTAKGFWLAEASDDFEYHSGDAAAPASEAAQLPEPDPERPAAIFFSTGSTGEANRITRTHANLAHEIRSVAAMLDLSAQDRILAAVPMFHTYGFATCFLSALLTGASLHFPASQRPQDIAVAIGRDRVTGLPGVPVLLQSLAEINDAVDASALRYVLSAGAPLPAETAAAFRAKFGVPVRGLYGTSETGVVTIEADGEAESDRSVGLPIAGVKIEILDDNGSPLPAGSEGNVAITSSFAASRYEGPKRKRESSFVGDRFLPGDQGRITTDGRLVLSGRKRGFINVGGNKVDPTEVEAVLMSMPGVTEAVVIGIPDGAAGEQIKAVLVTERPLPRLDIDAYCATRLADFKRPREIEFRDRLPRSPIGKILRSYLASHEEGRPHYPFDARIDFAAGDSAGDADELSTLPPVLRLLLVTDGTISRALEAYFWEPIDTEVLRHDDVGVIAKPDSPFPDGARITRRQVVLRGRVTRSIYLFAETSLVRGAFPPSFESELVSGWGIGQLIRQERLETYREISRIATGRAGDWAQHLGVDPSAPVATRDYAIRHRGMTVARISEVFAAERFE